VLTPRDVVRITGRARVGQVIRVIALRRGRSLTFRLKIAARPKPAELIRLYLLNTPAPDFELPLINRSGRLRLSSLRGKVVMLYFWGSDCDSCKLNMPRLKSLYRNYRNRGFVIYSLGEDKRVSTLKATTRQLGIPFVVGHNPKNLIGRRLYKTNVKPTVVVIDKRGIIRDYLQGSSYRFSRLERAVKKLL
jgi:peroxiredoxin